MQIINIEICLKICFRFSDFNTCKINNYILFVKNVYWLLVMFIQKTVSPKKTFLNNVISNKIKKMLNIKFYSQPVYDRKNTKNQSKNI